MSVWWVKKDQLDAEQLKLIEDSPLAESFLIQGPPGSGKTNVLLRRAQFVRSQGMSNVLVLNFTRPLTEFVKTGCYDSQGREIFPVACVTTLESWLRDLHSAHGQGLPPRDLDLIAWKQRLARSAMGLAARGLMPQYDALFIDEAQDLLVEEIAVLREWSQVLFFAGDDRQHIYRGADNLATIRSFIQGQNQRTLPFHYRLCPEICRAADKVLIPRDGHSLESGCHYQGPRPGMITAWPAASRDRQIFDAASKLKEQLRAFGDLIQQGDRLAIFVPRQDDRGWVHSVLEQDPDLAGSSQIIRSRDEGEVGYDPTFSANCPISILTVQGCKGLEFRSVHWLFCDDLAWAFDNEHYYTAVTRAKTQLDLYREGGMPQVLARAYSDTSGSIW